MRIAMLSPEITPFAKTGGLADVVGTLSLALERRGHELCLIMPAYRSVLRQHFRLEETPLKLAVPVSDRHEEGSVLRTTIGQNISVYFICAERYFDRDGLYGTSHGDYPDNAQRYVFFSRAALEVLRQQPVEVVHCHDWHCALSIVFLKTQHQRYPELLSAKTVLTVHNLGFQGIFGEAQWQLLDLDRSYFTSNHLEFYGNINFLKGGLTFADKITTVSPSYAREIMDMEQGFGLDGVLRQRAPDVVGILNGVDYEQWSPQTDPFIARHYSEHSLTAKRVCKKSLQQSLGLPAQSDVALLGIICRLTSQKGIDLVEKIFDALMERELQMVLLGNGEMRYEQFFTSAATCFPEKFAARIGFDEALAHQIEAGADIFLMPSLYEPCGLNQMFSLKYGTIPVVRAVGGLKDTVEDYDSEKSTGTGFVFDPYEAQALLEAIERALRIFKDKTAWTAIRRQAMSLDFSWDRSAQLYSALYQELAH
jgi:starch synthase